ncbi:MAG: hypothetical protein ACLFNW_09595 [Desulfobacterales bacterium]
MQKFFNKDMKTAFSAGLILVFIFFAATAGASEPEKETRAVSAFGSSPVIRDVAGAKKAAISHGLLSAVQSAASDLLSAQEIRSNFEDLVKILDRQQDEFIREYRILAEFKGQKNHHVLIQATVSNRKIMEALKDAGIISGSQQMPSLLVMIAEKNIDDLNFEYWWQRGYGGFSEAASVGPVKEMLREKGFTVIEPPAGDANATNLLEGLKPGAEPAFHEAAIIANRLGADLVLVGTATAESTANRMGEDVRSFKAMVNLRVIDAKTGEKLTTVREQAINMGDDPEKEGKNALADAAYRAGGKISERIVSLLQEGLEPTEKIAIHVKGEPVLAHLEKLRNTLKQQTGVSELRTTEMTAKSAALALEYQGTAQKLADNLLMHSFEGFGVNISDISSGELTVELIPD